MEIYLKMIMEKFIYLLILNIMNKKDIIMTKFLKIAIISIFVLCSFYATISKAEVKITEEMYFLGYVDAMSAVMDGLAALTSEDFDINKVPETDMSKYKTAFKMAGHLGDLFQNFNLVRKIAGQENMVKLTNSCKDVKNTIRDVKSDVFKDKISDLYAKWDNTTIIDSYGEATAKAKISSVKANMHTLQTMVETYAVDFGGKYPRNITELKNEAQKLSYWKDLANPFTKNTGIGKDGSLLDYGVYQSYKPHPEFKGLVIYQPIWKGKEGGYVNYKIYGCSADGTLIQDKGTVFLLTNT